MEDDAASYRPTEREREVADFLIDRLCEVHGLNADTEENATSLGQHVWDAYSALNTHLNPLCTNGVYMAIRETLLELDPEALDAFLRNEPS